MCGSDYFRHARSSTFSLVKRVGLKYRTVKTVDGGQQRVTFQLAGGHRQN